MRLRVAIFLAVVCLSLVVFSCRRNQPTLVDANRAPDTELWYSPPDSSESDYLVHLYWRGLDVDGVAVRYIWTITDTLLPPSLDWDPSTRIRDFRRGRITTRNDSVFSFTAFRDVSGVGVKKNRQAFHISAIDDNGVIDPSPARVQFIATVETLPTLRFLTKTASAPQKMYNPNDIDTVGMYRPFEISYRGFTNNGVLQGYRFFPLTTGVTLDGQDEWTDDLSDTLIVFSNSGVDTLPSGEMKLAAQCVDDAGAQSVVDAAGFTQGVARMVVNFEPDTRIFAVLNTYFKGNVGFVDTVRFGPGVPTDTVPFASWVKLIYNGWDDSRDSSRCTDVDDRCIKYQLQYTRTAQLGGGPSEGGSTIQSTIRWLPDDAEDSQPGSTSDSTSLNIGSEQYAIRVRSIDEYGKPDGTPDEVKVLGNFKPTLDLHGVQGYDGNIVPPGDTLVWSWSNPAKTTVDTSDPLDIQFVKTFYFVVRGAGHDHPKERDGAGIKSWLYTFRRTDDPSIIQKFAHAGAWTDGKTVNAFADTFKLVVRYPLNTDPTGDIARSMLPSYFNKGYTFSLRGRDLASTQRFDQIIWLYGEPVTQNSFNTSTLGRLTGWRSYDFFFAMKD